MKTFLDDEPHQVDDADVLTVGQVMEHVRSHVHAQERILTAIRCDGAEIEQADLERVLGEPTRNYARLDFASGTAGELAMEALSQVQAALMDLESNRDEAVEKLDQGQTAEAMTLLRGYFETWAKAHETILQSARLMQVDLMELSLDETSLSEFFGQFVEQLRRLKEAFEAGDHVTIADVMKYEAQETTQRWVRLIELLKELAQER